MDEYKTLMKNFHSALIIAAFLLFLIVGMLFLRG